MEKLSYALGLLIGHNLKGMNIDGLVTAEFTRAVEQVLKGEKAEMTDIPKSNVLIYYTEDGTKVAIRPSGTEPKIKFYFSVKSNISSESEYAGQVDKLNHKIEQIKKDLSL